MDSTLHDTVVHDLKNQLAILMGDLESAEIAHPECADIVRARQRAGAVVNRLVGFLMLRRAKDGGMSPVPGVNDPLTLLAEVADSAWQHIGRSLHVEVLNDDGASPDYWLFDDYLVRLVLDAALGNAGRYAKSRITLRALVREGMLVLRVEDDGPGLGTSSAGPASTGLGTQLCETIAAAHVNHGRRGQVRLFNGTHGGAVFELMLP